MRSRAALLLLASTALWAQDPLDGGRLQAAWFPGAGPFTSSSELGHGWIQPGLNLRGRGLRVQPWDPTVWLAGPRAGKDEGLLLRLEPDLRPDLAAALRKALKGVATVSLTEGDVRVVARVVDALGERPDPSVSDPSYLSVDLKLVDGDTGALLAAFHATLQGMSPDVLGLRYQDWCAAIGRALALAAPPAAKPTASQGLPKGSAAAAPPAPPAAPPFDLEGALRRIEGLRRDGLLSEAEAEALRRKAAEKART
jgi:hypothetical protein